MKRQAFVLSGAGAALAGCAGSALAPNPLIDSAKRPSTQHPMADSDKQLLGSLLLVPYDFVPQDFEVCAGQILPIKTNLALFAVLGIRFGGDGKDTFGLPDMRGKEPIKGLSYLIAMRGIFPTHKKAVERNVVGGDPLLGQLLLVPYVPAYVPPRDWARCDGQLLKIDNYAALYALVGDKFGGDGKTTFALPDLRGHELIKGLTYVIALFGRFPRAR
jgi:microcystin-dependent protein